MVTLTVADASPLYYCHRLDVSPRRLYATKTSYDDVIRSRDDIESNESGCVNRCRSNSNENYNDEDLDSALSGVALVGCGDCLEELERNWNGSFNHGLKRFQSIHQTASEKGECQPVNFYLLARHGTRFNKFANMNRMAQRLNMIKDLIKLHASKGSMCKEDLDWLGDWKPRHTVQDNSKLSRSGWMELLKIGQRYGQLFPEIFRRQGYSSSLYEFRYTNYTGKGDRTRQSARAFAEGLWGPTTAEMVEMIENPRPDWLLQFYEHCNKYLRDVSSNPVEDFEKFKVGSEMTKVIADINTRLGLPIDTLGFHEVYLIFENCRLEHGLYRDAPWCSILTPSMLEVIEYHQDIKYYWEDGYGHSISYAPACTLVSDILQHLRDDSKLGRFRFAHSGTLDSLYTRIGLYEDAEPLRFNNFEHHRRSRRWTTSRSTPMAANIAFVKYRCAEPPILRVMTVVNENIGNPIVIRGCPPGPLCPLETLQAVWRPIAEDCDIDRICEQSVMTTSSSSSTTTDPIMLSDDDLSSSSSCTSSSSCS